MNKSKRKRLEKAVTFMELALDVISDVRYEEQDSMSNMPENLQNSDRYSDMESAVDNMEDSEEIIKEILELISEAIGKVDNATA